MICFFPAVDQRDSRMLEFNINYFKVSNLIIKKAEVLHYYSFRQKRCLCRKISLSSIIRTAVWRQY